MNRQIDVEKIEELFEEYTRQKEKTIGLSNWLFFLIVPFGLALETSLQDTFSYKLPGAGWQRVEWSIVLFAIFSFCAILTTASVYYTRLRWNHPSMHFDLIHSDSLVEEMHTIMEKVNTFEFAMSFLPLVWFLPFVLFQVMVTEINDYYHPNLDYNRVVDMWAFTGGLGFFTLWLAVIVTYLHAHLRHPRRTVIKDELVYQMVELGAISHGYKVHADGSICGPEEEIDPTCSSSKAKKKKKKKQRGAVP